MAIDPADVDPAVRDLLAVPVHPSELPTRVPRASGLYAWWAPPGVLPDLPGPQHPTESAVRLLYVGIASTLRTRLVGNHLRRSGSSTLRRTIAGLLLHEQGFRTRWTDRVVLVDEDEARLTEWMHRNLRVSWCEHASPREMEAALIHTLRPPLNVDHSSGPTRETITAARLAYYASAGPPTAR